MKNQKTSTPYGETMMKKSKVSDSLPFKHNEEGSHYTCPEMVEKFGDKVGCCACTKHDCYYIRSFPKGTNVIGKGVIISKGKPIEEIFIPDYINQIQLQQKRIVPMDIAIFVKLNEVIRAINKMNEIKP